MIKILYIMGDSWYWIKQRPHFIAELLGTRYEVDVIFEKRYTRRVMNIPPEQLKLNEIFKFPFAHNFAVRRINDFTIGKLGLRKYIRRGYDIIWFNSWKHYKYAEPYISEKAKIVYDCMDDFTEFQGSKKNERTMNEILEYEKKLFLRSDLVICSSGELKNTLIKRYGVKDIHVINNAMNLPENPYESGFPGKECFREGYKNILFTGSVSEWFDFDLLIETLEKFEMINFVLIGPSDVIIPKHERIVYHSAVEHNQVFKAMESADMLVMPFKLTGLVKSVNPVKIYEYIYSGKPSLVLKYGETAVFEDYVYLYETKEDFFGYIEMLLNGSLKLKKDRKEYAVFAENNTWKARSEEIHSLLNKIIK